jgi:hypothetical protein
MNRSQHLLNGVARLVYRLFLENQHAADDS